jgi:hypothetical protein
LWIHRRAPGRRAPLRQEGDTDNPLVYRQSESFLQTRNLRYMSARAQKKWRRMKRWPVDERFPTRLGPAGRREGYRRALRLHEKFSQGCRKMRKRALDPGGRSLPLSGLSRAAADPQRTKRLLTKVFSRRCREKRKKERWIQAGFPLFPRRRRIRVGQLGGGARGLSRAFSRTARKAAAADPLWHPAE